MGKKKDEIDREARERLAAELYAEALRIPSAKPKPVAVLTVPVSERIAKAAQANPQSVRVSACGQDGVSVFDGAKHNSNRVVVRVDLVREVDAQGRPVWDQARVVHEYNRWTGSEWKGEGDGKGINRAEQS